MGGGSTTTSGTWSQLAKPAKRHLSSAKKALKALPKQIEEEFWRTQRRELEQKLRKSKWRGEHQDEARALLQWWRKLQESGESRGKIQTTIRDYLIDEYELHLRTIDEATQAACSKSKPSALMSAWGDPCRPMFDRKFSRGFHMIQEFRRELLLGTTSDRTGVGWQVHRWYLRFWLQVTPEGMLRSMYASALVGAIAGGVQFMANVAALKFKPRFSTRLPATYNRRRKTNQRVDTALKAKGSTATSKWKQGDYFKESGMPRNHFKAILEVVDEEGLIPVFRLTNLKSMEGIRKGFPAKKIDLSLKTSPTTGIVTAKTESESGIARKAGYYVVDSDLVPRNAEGKAMKLGNKPDWRVKPGQVIDPVQKKPVVGDYDLLGVIDLKAPGRNISLATSDGKSVKNRTNPQTERLVKAINAKLDQPRAMHGAADQFADLADEGAIVFLQRMKAVYLPDGASVKKLYEMIKRVTVKGTYNP
jgi:hypothetical protein